MGEQYVPVYILNSRAEADSAIDILEKSGIDVGKLSIVGSLSALGAALARTGVARERTACFEAALSANKYLLMVRGNNEDLARVNCVLASSTGLENA